MPLLKKATVRSYDPAGHRAAVQVAGSLAVWLDAVPVATDVPPSDVVPGRACSLLFLDDHNPADAVVLEVHGALPSGGSGTPTAISDADADTKVEVEASPDEDKIRLTVAGVLRALLQTTAPQITLTGDTRIDNNVGIQSAPQSGSPYVHLTIKPALTNTTWRGVECSPALTLSGGGNAATAIFGSANVTIPAATSGHAITGLNFGVAAVPGGASAAATALTGCVISPRVLAFGGSLTVTSFRGYQADPLGGLTVIGATLTLTAAYGAHILGGTVSNPSITIPTYYGLKIDDAGGTSITNSLLLEIGPATPYLRVAGGAAPGALLTNVWVDVGTVGLRQVQVGAANSGGAGFRQVIVPN